MTESALQKAKQARYDKLGQKVVKALEQRHFEAYYVSTAKEAAELAFKLIPEDHVVSWGGSETVEDLGIQKELKTRGYQVIGRDEAKSPEERTNLMRSALLCDTFLMSSNAISEDGQMFNIDGNGNRVAAMAYGPKSVIVMAGMNKVVKSQADAVSRARNIVAPTRTQYFPQLKTPCQINGACSDCTSTDCVCTYLVTTRMSKPAKRIKVILIGEDLGI